MIRNSRGRTYVVVVVVAVTSVVVSIVTEVAVPTLIEVENVDEVAVTKSVLVGIEVAVTI